MTAGNIPRAQPAYDFHRSLWERTGRDRHAARATVYSWARALPLLARLAERGIVDERGRDTTTGRKVGSIVAEVARLGCTAGPETPSEEQLDELVEVYLRLRDLPIASVRATCCPH